MGYFVYLLTLIVAPGAMLVFLAYAAYSYLTKTEVWYVPSNDSIFLRKAFATKALTVQTTKVSVELNARIDDLKDAEFVGYL